MNNYQNIDCAIINETELRHEMRDRENSVDMLMRKLAEKGLSIIFVSSEIKEVLAVADRVLVLAKGKINKELIGSEITEDNLVKFSQG